MNQIKKFQEQIEAVRAGLLEIYGASTDRELFKDFSPEQKARVFSWINYQMLYYQKEAYTKGLEAGVRKGKNKYYKKLRKILNIG